MALLPSPIGHLLTASVPVEHVELWIKSCLNNSSSMAEPCQFQLQLGHASLITAVMRCSKLKDRQAGMLLSMLRCPPAPSAA